MIQGETYTVHIGNNLDILPTLEDNFVDSIVTDPPYELGFMGKKWDSTGIAYNPDLWRECLRVLKPGGHLLSFGGSRTWHRIAVAIEDSGFEVRDSIAWLYGSGFPKSLDISKAIDKQAGAEREKIKHKARPATSGTMSGSSDTRPWIEKSRQTGFHEVDGPEAVTPEAQQWQGWGTALKPAFEPVIVARKPLIGTVAENVLTYGTGGLNIDGSRVGTDNVGWQGSGRSGESVTAGASRGGNQGGYNFADGEPRPVQGRWPANVILDEHTAAMLDEQSGITKDGLAVNRNRTGQKPNDVYGKFGNLTQDVGFGGSGGASRFFYVAKASKRDRNEGLEELEERLKIGFSYSDEPNDPANGMFKDRNTQSRNFHPTVKPTDLMRYLIKLVTPPNGIVLDPFTGSGSTGKAAILEGFRFIGIEMTEDYIPIIAGRLKHAEREKEKGLF